jgi:HEAT repeat protein
MLDFEGIAAVDDLLTAIQHEQALIRHRAIHMVAKQHNDPRVIPALMAIMRAPDALVETREIAARALGDCGRAGVDTLLDAYGESSLRDYAGKGLLQSGDLRAFDIALEWLLMPDSSKRASGLFGLERMLNALDTSQKAQAVAALVQRVRQGDENSFAPASKVIAQFGDLAVEPMFEILGDPSLDRTNEAVRTYALDALWRIQQAAPSSLGSRFSESVRRLVNIHDNKTLKATAIHILARLPDPDALDDLLRMLDTQRDDAAGLPAVVYAIGQQHDPRALPALRALLDHWKSQPQTFENFELIDEIEGAIDHIERNLPG